MRFIFGTKEIKRGSPMVLTDIVLVKTTADADDYMSTHHVLHYELYNRPLVTPSTEYYIIGEYQKNYCRIYIKTTLNEARQTMYEKLNELTKTVLSEQQTLNKEINKEINITVTSHGAILQTPQTTTSYLIVKGN